MNAHSPFLFKSETKKTKKMELKNSFLKIQTRKVRKWVPVCVTELVLGASAILSCGWKQWCEALVDSRCHDGRIVVGQAPLIAQNISNGVELGAGLDNVVHGVANC